MEANVIYFSWGECGLEPDMDFIGAVSPVPYPMFSLDPEVSSVSSFSENSVANRTDDVSAVNTSGSASDSCTCLCRKVGIESMSGKCIRYAGSKAINAGERELSQFTDYPMAPIHSQRFHVEDIAFASGECQKRCGRCNAEEDLKTGNVDVSRRDRLAHVSCKCNNSENFNARICVALENLCALKKSDSKLLYDLTCEMGKLQKQQTELYAAMSDRSKESSCILNQKQNERGRWSKCKCDVGKSEQTNCSSESDDRITNPNVRFKQTHSVSNKKTYPTRKKLPYERLPDKVSINSSSKVVQCEREKCEEKIPSFYEKLLRKAEKFLQRHTEGLSQNSRPSSEATKSLSTREIKIDDISRSMCPDEIDICERTVRSQGNDLIDAKTSYHLSDVISVNAPVVSNLSLESRRYLQRYKIIPT